MPSIISWALCKVSRCILRFIPWILGFAGPVIVVIPGNYSQPVLFRGYYELSLPSLVLTCNWMFSLLHSQMHAELGGVVWPTGTLFIHMFHLDSIYLYRATAQTDVCNLCLNSPAGSVPGKGRGVATSSTTFAPRSLSSWASITCDGRVDVPAQGFSGPKSCKLGQSWPSRDHFLNYGTGSPPHLLMLGDPPKNPDIFRSGWP